MFSSLSKASEKENRASNGRLFNVMGIEPVPNLTNQRVVYVFGVFELDLHARELRKHGVKIKLQDQPLEILTLLLENAGQIVSRKQIQVELWKAGTHVDYENAINSAVRKLREALGDTAENPRFIETLPRRGYRFIAPVADRMAIAEIPTPRLVAPPAAVGERRGWRKAAVFLALAAGLGAAGWFALAGRPSINTQLTPPVPLTGAPGAECCPSFSPDGSRVVYSAIVPGGYTSDIFIKQIGPGEPLQLTQNPAMDAFPAWSPDGRWIAFLRAIDDRRAVILLMPSLGGPERELARINFMARKCVEGAVISWSADGKYLYTIENDDPSAAYAIIRLDTASGEKQQITNPPPGTVGDGAPSMSPDGRSLAFTRIITKLTNSDIYVLPLSGGGEARRITFDSKLVGGHAWSADGREIIFLSDRGGRFELWRVGVSGEGPPVRLTGAGESGTMFEGRQYLDISRQGNRLVYTQPTVAGPNLWLVEITGDRASKPTRIASSMLGDLAPQYLPDGKKIAFQSSRSGKPEVWVVNEDGSAPLQLSFSESGFSGSPRWSPDGRSIAFDSSRTGSWDIYVVNSQGGTPRALTTNPATDAIPSWSRDGKSVYFASTRTGRYEVWKTPVTGGLEIQVTSKGGLLSAESVDGKYLYYTKTEGNGPLWRMPIEGGEEVQVLPSVGGRDFVVTAGRIYFLETANSGTLLRFLDLATNATTTLVSLGHGCFPAFTVSSDERSIVFAQDRENFIRSQFGSRLMLVENFR